MFLIRLPDNLRPERQYVCDVIFRVFFGIATEIKFEARRSIRLELAGSSGEICLELDDSYFAGIADAGGLWIPKAPLRFGMLPETVDGLPQRLEIFSGTVCENEAIWARNEHGIHLGLDVLGTAFFFLTR